MQKIYLPSQFLRLWVLVWFVVVLFAAVAASSIQPRTIQLVCSGTGAAKLFTQTDNGLIPAETAGMECPLCLTADSPPPLGAAPILRTAVFYEAPPPSAQPPPLAGRQTRPPVRAPPIFS